MQFGLRPIGVLDDGTNFFVTDPYGNGDLYRLPASGGSASSGTTAADGFFGIALSHGVYYGTEASALRSFDPKTLAPGSVNVPLPQSANWAVVGDPLTTDVYVSSYYGIYRIQNPASSSPTVTQFAAGNYDGIAFTGDGQHLWAAFPGTSSVEELSRTGTPQATVPDNGGPDGIAIANHGAVVGGINVSDNVFVNDNDGTVLRIDTNNGDATSVVASGGSRGDFGTVGPDGCFYVTQTDRVEKLAPCFFQPTSGQPSSSPPPPPPATAKPGCGPKKTRGVNPSGDHDKPNGNGKCPYPKEQS